MIVSVIMPVYNGEKYIAEAIESILNQTFQNYELIIINDASTDNTVNIIENYKDSRIRLIQNNSNLGLGLVRNIGLNNARGKYIAWLDSDDINMDTRLEKQVNLLENNPNIGLCGTWVKTIGNAENVWKFPIQSDFIKSNMLFHNCFAASSVMLRREIIIKHKYFFSLEYLFANDYEFWEKISNHCNIANIPEILTYYRLHPSQNTFSIEAKKKQSEYAWKIQERMFQRLNIFPNEKEKAIHLKLGLQSNFKFSSLDDIISVYEWLVKLYQKNLEYNIFNNDVFKLILSNVLYAVCRSSGMGIAYFYRAPFQEFDLRHIYRTTKLLVKKSIRN